MLVLRVTWSKEFGSISKAKPKVFLQDIEPKALSTMNNMNPWNRQF